MEQYIEDLTLLGMYLTSWEENVGTKDNPINVHRTWKGYPFEIINTLLGKDDVRGSFRAKSVMLTAQGIERAKQLEKQYLP
jgi:hypothetical protein